MRQAAASSSSVSCAPSSRALNRSAPRYTASAPFATAARTASREQAGARSSGIWRGDMGRKSNVGRVDKRAKSLKALKALKALNALNCFASSASSASRASSALAPLRRQVLQRVPDVSFTQSLERAVAELANALTRDPEHLAD